MAELKRISKQNRFPYHQSSSVKAQVLLIGVKVWGGGGEERQTETEREIQRDTDWGVEEEGGRKRKGKGGEKLSANRREISAQRLKIYFLTWDFTSMHVYVPRA